MPVGVRAARARLQGRGLGSHALEPGQHLGVLAAGGAVVGGPQRLVELVELLLQRRRALVLAEGVLELRGDLLEGVAGLAELPGLVLAPASGDDAEVGGLHEHERPEGLGRAGKVAHGRLAAEPSSSWRACTEPPPPVSRVTVRPVPST